MNKVSAYGPEDGVGRRRASRWQPSLRKRTKGRSAPSVRNRSAPLCRYYTESAYKE